jgi:RNA polymerase sigma factor (sigma-70 family)
MFVLRHRYKMTIEEEHNIIDKVLSGNTNSFARLVDEYKHMTFTVAVRILRNREDAEETAMDAFIKAYEKLNEFNKSSKFSSWLYKIAYNAAIDKKRKVQPDFLSMDSISDESTYLDKIMFENAADELGEITEKDRELYVRIALESLSEDESVIISLYYLSGTTVKEIADITGLSVSNVKVKLFRSRNKLYDELKRLLKDEISSLL